jgi:hypothetical protein
LIRTEAIVISCIVNKINRRGKPQQRRLLITDLALYNLDKSLLGRLSCRRRIEVKKINPIFVCLETSEFVLHVEGEYDYRFRHPNPHQVNVAGAIEKYFFSHLMT